MPIRDMDFFAKNSMELSQAALSRFVELKALESARDGMSTRHRHRSGRLWPTEEHQALLADIWTCCGLTLYIYIRSELPRFRVCLDAVIRLLDRSWRPKRLPDSLPKVAMSL